MSVSQEEPVSETSGPPTASRYLAVVQASGRHFGVLVDAVIDQQEIVVKPLPRQLSGVQVFSGATLLGDGRVALILDVLGVAERARVVSEKRDEVMTITQLQRDERRGPLQTLLLMRGVDDGRLAINLDSVSRLETIPIDALESAGDFDVIQYRGEIMPLVYSRQILPERRARPRHPEQQVVPSDALSIVILGEAGAHIGLVVEDVLDVIETNSELHRIGCRRGVSGTLVLQERVTEVLDLSWVAAQMRQRLDEAMKVSA